VVRLLPVPLLLVRLQVGLRRRHLCRLLHRHLLRHLVVLRRVVVLQLVVVGVVLLLLVVLLQLGVVEPVLVRLLVPVVRELRQLLPLLL
jgi:hypothetical protein